MTRSRQAGEILELQQQWAKEALPHDILNFVDQTRLHLPHATVVGQHYGDSLKILFIGAEAAMCYCNCDADVCSCTYQSRVQCDDCRAYLQSANPSTVAKEIASYWQDVLSQEGTTARTPWWRRVNELAAAVSDRDGHGSIADTIAWANLYRHSYLWQSDEESEKKEAQLAGRARIEQNSGFLLLREEINVLDPDLIVLFTPEDDRSWNALKSALAIKRMRGRDPLDYWGEKVDGRNVGIWHDESEPASLVRPIIVRAGHPMWMRAGAFDKAVEYAKHYLALTKPY